MPRQSVISMVVPCMQCIVTLAGSSCEKQSGSALDVYLTHWANTVL